MKFVRLTDLRTGYDVLINVSDIVCVDMHLSNQQFQTTKEFIPDGSEVYLAKDKHNGGPVLVKEYPEQILCEIYSA